MTFFDTVMRRYRHSAGRLRTNATSAPSGDAVRSHAGFGADRDPTRLLFFSDAVFAIAVTLLVLDIRPPRHTGHLLDGLVALHAAVSRRFRLALIWIATGTLLGLGLPVLGVVVIAAFIPFYWRPIPGETSTKREVGRDESGS